MRYEKRDETTKEFHLFSIFLKLTMTST